MRFIIGSDHGGVERKREIIEFLEKKGHSVENRGVDTEDSVDYPDIVRDVCGQYKRGDYDYGILLCGTGIGVSICANKISGIRCALLFDEYTARMAKAHNNANFIAFGGRNTYSTSITAMITTFIDTEFEGGRHQRRVGKIAVLEEDLFGKGQ
jgi:ribose 5-phosphate isomerase B